MPMRVTVRSTVLGNGYSQPSDIAHRSRAAFVAATRDNLGNLEAARVHAVARAQTAALNNLWTGLRARPELVGPDAADLLVPDCKCDDCHAATSPLAYLASLLDYAIGHVKKAPLD